MLSAHLEQLVAIDDSLKRTFYKVECVRGGWSVRGLRRQIVSLCFERSTLSKDKAALGKHILSMAEPNEPGFVLRDPVVFEFFGVGPQGTMLDPDPFTHENFGQLNTDLN